MSKQEKEMGLRGFIAGLILVGLSGVAQATMFIYQLPNGTRVITDHQVYNKNYKLIRTGQTYSGMGQMLASKNRQFFRADTSTYDRLIRLTAKQHRIDRALVKAIIHAESAFNPYATSKKGARGLMQLMPSTAEIYGVRDIYDPRQNIGAGVRHLKYLLKKYRYNSHLAIAAYNAGEGAIKRYRGVPPYKETRRYVQKVLRYKRHYKKVQKRGA